MRQISEENFLKLQKHAVPLVDTLDDVLARILDIYEQHLAKQQNAEAGEPTGLAGTANQPIREFAPDAPPNLTFTSIRSVSINKKPFHDKFWNPLLFELIKIAAKKLGLPRLRQALDVNYVDGETDKTSFVWLPEAGISVQGRDANLCWRSIYKLVVAADIELEVDFYWQHNPKAEYAGKSGRFFVPA